jgi:hypothetical protein
LRRTWWGAGFAVSHDERPFEHGTGSARNS